MKHIVSNPHNGAHVSHDGIELPPGSEVHVLPHIAQDLLHRFGFLLMRLIEGTDQGVQKAQPQKIPGTLQWKPANTGSPHQPSADTVQHTVVQKVPRKRSAPKTAATPVVVKKK